MNGLSDLKRTESFRMIAVASSFHLLAYNLRRAGKSYMNPLKVIPCCSSIFLSWLPQGTIFIFLLLEEDLCLL